MKTQQRYSAIFYAALLTVMSLTEYSYSATPTTKLPLLPDTKGEAMVTGAQEKSDNVANANRKPETAKPEIKQPQTETSETDAREPKQPEQPKEAVQPKEPGQPKEPVALSEQETAQIEGWIEQLSESSLTKRRKAKTELTRAGAAAIPFLAKAALSSQRDVIVYSIEVLGEIARKSKDESAKKAARVTLEMLAESEQPSTSERARKMLKTQPADQIEAFPKWNDPKNEFAGGGRGMNRSVTVSNVNGMKTIRVEDGGRVTTLRDESRGRIRVSIEEGDDTKEFVAKNAEDLQEQDPAAYAIYAQQSNGFGGMATLPQIPGFGNFQGGAVGAVAGEIGGGVAGNGPQTQQMMILQLEELKQRLADNPQLSQMLEMQIQSLRAQGN